MNFVFMSNMHTMRIFNYKTSYIDGVKWVARWNTRAQTRIWSQWSYHFSTFSPGLLMNTHWCKWHGVVCTALCIQSSRTCTNLYWLMYRLVELHVCEIHQCICTGIRSAKTHKLFGAKAMEKHKAVQKKQLKKKMKAFFFTCFFGKWCFLPLLQYVPSL